MQDLLGLLALANRHVILVGDAGVGRRCRAGPCAADGGGSARPVGEPRDGVEHALLTDAEKAVDTAMTQATAFCSSEHRTLLQRADGQRG